MAARAEKAEAELATVKAELEAARPAAKTPTCDPLQCAILETLQTMAMAWPNGEIPSSRLWAAVVDRGAVAIVRPGQAAEGEADRFYKAKMALIRDGLISNSRGFVRLASAPSCRRQSWNRHSRTERQRRRQPGKDWRRATRMRRRARRRTKAASGALRPFLEGVAFWPIDRRVHVTFIIKPRLRKRLAASNPPRNP